VYRPFLRPRFRASDRRIVPHANRSASPESHVCCVNDITGSRGLQESGLATVSLRGAPRVRRPPRACRPPRAAGPTVRHAHHPTGAGGPSACPGGATVRLAHQPTGAGGPSGVRAVRRSATRTSRPADAARAVSGRCDGPPHAPSDRRMRPERCPGGATVRHTHHPTGGEPRMRPDRRPGGPTVRLAHRATRRWAGSPVAS
jgi:hypothetical protein